MSTQATYEEVLAQVQLLSDEDQGRLLEDLVASLRRRIQEQQREEKRRSILEFEGMDQESWKDINAREYINQERDSWTG